MPEVTDPNILAQLNGGASQGPALRPVLSLPDPDKEADNARADAQLGLSGEAQRLAQEKSARERLEWEATHNPDGSLKPDAGKATEAQTKSAQFLGRMLLAERQFLGVPEGSRDARTAVGQWLHEAAPNVENSFNSPDRQMADQAARNFIAASLRQESGAAISPQEYANQYRIFFPMPGDSPEVIAQKAEARRQAIEGFRISSGPLAHQVDAQYRQGQRDDPAAAAAAQGGAQGGGNGGGAIDPQMRGGLPVGTEIQWGADQPETPFDRERYLRENHGITGDQETQITAFWNQNRGNPNLTVENAAQWYVSQGLTPPDPQSLAESVDAARRGAQFGPIDTTAAEQAYRDRLRAGLGAQGFDPTSAGAYAARAARGLEMGLSDEIEGVGGAVDALFSNQGVADGYRLARDRSREAFAQMEEQQGGLGTVAELAGGLATGFGASRAPISVGRAAREGAAFGGLAGFGYGEGAQDSLAGAGLGAATGAGLGAAIGRAAEGMATRHAAQVPTPGAQTIAAADRLNAQFGTKIAPIPADVGGPGTRNATGSAAKMPLSAMLIGRTRDKVTEEGEKAASAIAALAGVAEGRPEVAGEAAIEAANKYIRRSKTKVNNLYEKARTLAGGHRVTMPNAQRQLETEIATLKDTPGGATGVEYLEGLLGRLDGDWPVDGVKRFRRQVRDKLVKDNLLGSEMEAAALRIVDAADDDIVDGLVSAGKADAAKAYAEASASAAERYRVIDDAIAPFIGTKKQPKSGEDVIKAIEAATANKSARLGKFMANLPEDDAANLRAALIERIGRPTKGAATEETKFSLDKFLTNWNGMTDRAKSALFGGELRAALDDLAKVASGRKEAGKSVNFSNTGGPIGWATTGSGVTAAGLTGSVAPLLISVLDASTGALLASPKFARWLAKMPSNPGMVEKHVQALSKIAATDSVIAADAAGLQRALAEALGQPLQAAAAPGQGAGTPTETEQGPRP